ncbi:hypothetical protein OE388_16025 [Pseudomonas aeruginosa]|uniref:hypothetical protein n=1 Tax=Pseudomonas aeruginosa TaxID=287 RepID=UPI00104CAAFA|nr:hypothetical protein [Pseudomonas aeruginosa]MCU9072603.1 hypothetical protein [Pseudomonas aeruginosa]MCU9146539.1 hypothetical protein [Pseudomonas aeruginosa]MCU9242323.1 hypothetical protein [Pseudomonas aeruginosa]MCU9272855.1 hypothetical protein [Pseudomonas aeruginosa]MCU9290566.1 hypothetical protein [Pseudomonas aeruginosa]
MLFPVIFRFQKKAGKTSCKLLAPENPPENPKNLTGKCPGGRVFAVSGGFSVAGNGLKNSNVTTETGKNGKPDRKLPAYHAITEPSIFRLNIT